LNRELDFDEAITMIRRARELIRQIGAASGKSADESIWKALADRPSTGNAARPPAHLEPGVRLDIGELHILLEREFRPRPAGD
jgi:hypothetical protein